MNRFQYIGFLEYLRKNEFFGQEESRFFLLSKNMKHDRRLHFDARVAFGKTA